MDPKAYANSLPVFRRGRNFYIEVINPVTYASYVEFGHRTRGGGGWVAGQYFLTLSEKDLERVAPAVIEKKLEALLRALEPYGVTELVQSGAVAIGRGSRSITDQLKEK